MNELEKDKVLAEADEALQTLNSYRPLDAMTVSRLREELKLESTYDSNAIEGSRLTLSETVLVVKDGVTAGGGHTIRDVMSARGYAHGFDAIFDFVRNEEVLTEVLIQNFHRYVMLGALPQYCGIYRDHDVKVVGAPFRPSDPKMIPFQMASLTTWFNEARDMHPIERAARFHAEFETIHPFSDGNGRTGRLLLNFMLVRSGYWPVNIRYAEDRESYYKALADFNVHGSTDMLSVLIARRASEQLNYCIHIARQKEALHSEREQ